MTTTTFEQWDQNTRLPNPPPPAHSTDCQIHVFDDPALYPPKPTSVYAPIAHATLADSQRMHRGLGFERVVIVHASIYGTDHRLLLDALEQVKHTGHYRGIAIVDDTVSDRELERLDAAGVRGARFNIVKFINEKHDDAAIRRSIDRIRELKWHARLHVFGTDLVERSEFLLSLNDIPLVIDHLAHVDYAAGVEQPSVRWILEALKRENWWMMVSNGNRYSRMEQGWDDVLPCARAFVEAAPDRIIWGSDWPHAMWTKRMMNDAEPVEDLLYRFVDNDPVLLRKILVDNPARLHGFPIE